MRWPPPPDAAVRRATCWFALIACAGHRVLRACSSRRCAVAPTRRRTEPWTPIGEVTLTPMCGCPCAARSERLRAAGAARPESHAPRRRSAGAPPPHSRHPAARAAARGEPARRPANAAALSLSRCGERSPRRCSCARVRRCARVPSPATSLAGARVRRRRRHGWLVDEAAARGDDDRGVRACALGGPACSCGIGARLAPGQSDCGMPRVAAPRRGRRPVPQGCRSRPRSVRSGRCGSIVDAAPSPSRPRRHLVVPRSGRGARAELSCRYVKRLDSTARG